MGQCTIFANKSYTLVQNIRRCTIIADVPYALVRDMSRCTIINGVQYTSARDIGCHSIRPTMCSCGICAVTGYMPPSDMLRLANFSDVPFALSQAKRWCAIRAGVGQALARDMLWHAPACDMHQGVTCLGAGHALVHDICRRVIFPATTIKRHCSMQMLRCGRSTFHFRAGCASAEAWCWS